MDRSWSSVIPKDLQLNMPTPLYLSKMLFTDVQLLLYSKKKTTTTTTARSHEYSRQCELPVRYYCMLHTYYGNFLSILYIYCQHFVYVKISFYEFLLENFSLLPV